MKINKIKGLFLILTWIGFLVAVSASIPPLTSSLSDYEWNSDYGKRYKDLKNLQEIILKIRPSLDPSSVDRISFAVYSTSRKYDLDPLMILAVMRTESSFNSRAISYRGAMGLMQVMPSTARHLAGELNYCINERKDLNNTIINVEIGTYYMSKLFSRYDSKKHALLAYNQGPGKLESRLSSGIIPSAGYFKRVQRHLSTLKQI